MLLLEEKIDLPASEHNVPMFVSYQGCTWNELKKKCSLGIVTH